MARNSDDVEARRDALTRVRARLASQLDKLRELTRLIDIKDVAAVERHRRLVLEYQAKQQAFDFAVERFSRDHGPLEAEASALDGHE